jgi:hypothetical protein
MNGLALFFFILPMIWIVALAAPLISYVLKRPVVWALLICLIGFLFT